MATQEVSLARKTVNNIVIIINLKTMILLRKSTKHRCRLTIQAILIARVQVIVLAKASN